MSEHLRPALARRTLFVSEEAGRDGDQVMPASTSVVCGDIVFPKRILDGVTNPQPCQQPRASGTTSMVVRSTGTNPSAARPKRFDTPGYPIARSYRGGMIQSDAKNPRP